MKKQSKVKPTETTKSVDKQELNLWKRGFTPQAEIWNGRMATIGIGIIFIIAVSYTHLTLPTSDLV